MTNATLDSRLAGTIGEIEVSKQINSIRRSGYTQIRDILIPSANGLSKTQIDHVVVSNYGIYCIETKSLNGLICGHTEGREWKQYLNSRSKCSFRNPIKQNVNHGKALNAVIGRELLNAKIVSLVVFPNARKITVRGKWSDSVGDLQHMKDMILHNKRVLYNDQEVKKIITRIMRADENNKDNLAKHIAEIKRVYPAAPV